MIPKHLITTWICDPSKDQYTEAHRELFARCLQSWLRLMPDYALTVVTLGNLFDHARDPWVEARLAEGNYIGASQWARLFWLQRFGGVYVDMDVEAVKRFDSLLDRAFVVGHMQKPKAWANNAVMASVAGHPFLQTQLDYIRGCDPADKQFGNNTGPKMLTNLLKARGWTAHDAHATVDGLTVLPSPVFYPYTFTETFSPACVRPETVAVHHWGKSWFARAGLVA